MNKERLIELIEKGKVVGKVISYQQDEDVIWSDIAIQKRNDKYVAYINEIYEKNMWDEEYIMEELKSFDDINEAFDFIESSSKVTVEELAPMKGSKIYIPLEDELSP